MKMSVPEKEQDTFGVVHVMQPEYLNKLMNEALQAGSRTDSSTQTNIVNASKSTQTTEDSEHDWKKDNVKTPIRGKKKGNGNVVSPTARRKDDNIENSTGGSKQDNAGSSTGRSVLLSATIVNHRCPECNIPFTRQPLLQRHIEMHNRPEFICHYCSKVYYDKEKLEVHIALHIGRKPYKCDKCKRRFQALSSLINHKRKHNRTKKKCAECGAAFRDAYELYRHSRTHLDEFPFKCDQCDKTFTQKGNLKTHYLRVHVGINRYKCEYCEDSFSSKHGMYRHLQKHKDERTYYCKYCNAKLATVEQIKQHILTVHEIQEPQTEGSLKYMPSELTVQYVPA